MDDDNVSGRALIVPAAAGGQILRGSALVVQEWPAEGSGTWVAPMHVHHADDEAWYVISGALEFRFADGDRVAEAGSIVLVPAGVAHTFGNTGPARSRFLIILSARLDALISELHQADPAEHAAIYSRHESQLLA